MARRTLVFLAVLAAATAAAAPAATPVRHETASADGVRATLSYARLRYGVYYVRLTVERDQQAVYDKRVQPYSRIVRLNQPSAAGLSGGKSITIRDLDGDGEPELLLDFWTGGAHCCVWTRVYHWDAAASTYVSDVHWWGDLGYSIADLGSGEPSFVSGDDRFAYAFASFAGSGFPIQIWSYRAGRLTDATASYRPLVARDADRQWRYYRSARKQRVEVRGVLAAWAADECRLDHGRSALPWLRAHSFVLGGFDGSTASYLRQLPTQLRRWGYPCRFSA
jgi:hypothetical protein